MWTLLNLDSILPTCLPSCLPSCLPAYQNWPAGLQEALIKSVLKIPIRYFVIDDSGSMLSNDGTRRVGEGPTSKIIRCTRWSELIASMHFHVDLAEVMLTNMLTNSKQTHFVCHYVYVKATLNLLYKYTYVPSHTYTYTYTDL